MTLKGAQKYAVKRERKNQIKCCILFGPKYNKNIP